MDDYSIIILFRLIERAYSFSQEADVNYNEREITRDPYLKDNS
jgi:hypothetical protein